MKLDRRMKSTRLVIVLVVIERSLVELESIFVFLSSRLDIVYVMLCMVLLYKTALMTCVYINKSMYAEPQNVSKFVFM